MKRMNQKVTLLCVLTIIISSFLVMPAFAVDTANQVTGEGTGVISQPPVSMTTNPGEIKPTGTEPPDPSNETITLGTYNGTIKWATGVLYSDKWVRTSGTSIKITGTFGLYKTKDDAINRKNPLSNLHPGVSIWLVDSSGKAAASKTITRNDGSQTISFNVTKNKDYYVVLDCRCGDYYTSGDFKVSK